MSFNFSFINFLLLICSFFFLTSSSSLISSKEKEWIRLNEPLSLIRPNNLEAYYSFNKGLYNDLYPMEEQE